MVWTGNVRGQANRVRQSCDCYESSGILSAYMCSRDHEGGGFILYRNQWADCFNDWSDSNRPSDCGRGHDGRGFVRVFADAGYYPASRRVGLGL